MTDNTPSSSKPQNETSSGAAGRNPQGTAAEVARQTAGAMQQSGRSAGEAFRHGGEISAEATQRSASAGADAMLRAGAASSETLRQGTQAVAEGQRQLAREAAQRFEEVSRKLSQAFQGTTENVRTFLTLPNAAGEGLNDLQRSMTGLIEGVVGTNVRAVQELFRLSNPGAVIELQQRFMREYLDVLMEGSATLVRAARKTADESLRPLEEKIEQRRQAERQQPHQAAAE